ncbi:MAG: hypothetical protein ACKPKO_17860, partial [Candidatus Fonsibacter sp.]
MEVEPGIVADIDFANQIYTIEEGDEQAIMEQEEATVMNNPFVPDDGDSEVEDAEISEGFVELPPLMSARTGAVSSSDAPIGTPAVVDALAWPPPVLPTYPLRFLDKDICLASTASGESGLPGGPSVVSPTSTLFRTGSYASICGI